MVLEKSKSERRGREGEIRRNTIMLLSCHDARRKRRGDEKRKKRGKERRWMEKLCTRERAHEEMVVVMVVRGTGGVLEKRFIRISLLFFHFIFKF